MQNLLLPPSSNFESVEIQSVTGGFAESPKIAPCQNIYDRFEGKKVAGFESTADTIREANSTDCGTRAILIESKRKVHGAQIR